MLTRIALIAAPELGLDVIRRELANPLKYTLREFLSMEEVNTGLASFSAEVLLARFRRFGPEQLRSVQKMRSLFPDTGLVTLVRETDGAAVFASREIPHHKMINENSELPDLARVVEKLRRHEWSGVRLHPRVARRGDAEILVMNPQSATAVAKWRAKFVDFAQMGARLVLEENPGRSRLEQGCRVQLHYRSSSEPTKMHRIETKVVWEKEVKGWISSQERMVALRFIAAL